MEDIKTCSELQLEGEQLLEAAEIAAELNPLNRVYIAEGTGVTEQSSRFSQALLTGKKWPQNHEVPISFLSGTETQKRFIQKHAQEWFDHINITPVWVDSGGIVRIEVGNGGGSWSYLGPDCLVIKDRNKPTMRFGWLDAPVVRHEWGHFLGMIHEHQHPGRPWEYDKPVVYKYYMGPPNNWNRQDVDRNVLQKYSESQVNAGDFNSKSIMLYSVPNRFTIGDYEVGWNQTIDESDLKFVASMYPKAQEPEEPEVPEPVEPEEPDEPEDKRPPWRIYGGWWEGRPGRELVWYPASNEFGSGSYRNWGWYETLDGKHIDFHPGRYT